MADPRITASPLSWPDGWKRTQPGYRTEGRFGTAGKGAGNHWSSTQPITIGAAVKRLRDELARMGVSEDDVIVSTNLKLRLDGFPRSDQGQPRDPGAAVYWQDGAHRRCMAIDRYTKVEQNIAALAATIEAMRAIERHGGAVVLERAFTGFAALPAPIAMSHKRAWHEVLEVHILASRQEVEDAYRRLRSKHHPDKPGGELARFQEVQTAYEEALKELAE